MDAGTRGMSRKLLQKFLRGKKSRFRNGGNLLKIKIVKKYTLYPGYSRAINEIECERLKPKFISIFSD
jgi:hypothetical protein